MKKNRPGSIFVVGWVTVITGIISFLHVLNLFKYYKSSVIVLSESDLLLIMLIASIVSVIYLICGIAILRGKNWGRVSYIIAIGIITSLTVLSSNFLLITIPHFFLYLVFTCLLLRPEAGKFFKPKKNRDIL